MGTILTEDQIKMIAREAAREVLREHVTTCPVAMKVELQAWRGLGKFIGLAFLGGGISGGIVSKLFNIVK